MKILVACEYSALVRDAFLAQGHDAWSCDIEPTEGDPLFHLQEDVLPVAHDPGQHWNMMVAFPPCTHLSLSGARWWPQKRADNRQQLASLFFRALWDAPIPRVAIENPVGFMNSSWQKPTQIIHPWQFGHGETKATCLWIRGLPLLEPTNIVDGRGNRIHRIGPQKNRAKIRSKTYEGIAKAMGEQWGTWDHHSEASHA